MPNSVVKELEYWADQNQQKLLFSFLDLNGDQIEGYSYEQFVQRTRIIASHLLNYYRFKRNDRLLLAYPPGLEIICAFFACARAGLIPVPVYPPSSHGFQAALYKMIHIAKDCDAAAVLTSSDYHRSLRSNLARSSIVNSSLDTNYISNLKWIVTEELVNTVTEQSIGNEAEILFLQYTSGSTSNPKGVMVSHENILHNCDLVVDHSYPIAVSWLPQYHDMGLIGYYLFSSLRGGTTYGFSPTDFIQRPSLWLETIKKYRASASSAPNFAYEYCLRPGRLSRETVESADLSSLRFLMAAAEPIKPKTYLRFLEMFQPCGLKPASFCVAYGLAENTLAVSHYGRNVLSVNKNALALRIVRPTTEVSGIAAATQVISCGKPLGDIRVKIVDPEKLIALPDGNVGEIWVAGRSKCQGYWNNPQLTQSTFHARIIGENNESEDYLRTGDMGFLHEGELYVCGRIKDMIIVRGQNYFPQDIESIVENESGFIRKTCVAAFQINEDNEPTVAVVAEVKNANTIPDPLKIAVALKNYLNLDVGLIAFIAPKAIPRTSSGKIMRQKTKEMWLGGEFRVLREFSREQDPNSFSDSANNSPFESLKIRYDLTGTESYSLIEAGLDSLDLVVFMHEIKQLLKDKGADLLAKQVDIRLIQHVTVAELFQLAEQLERSPDTAALQIRHSLVRLWEEQRQTEKEMMRRDQTLMFDPPVNGDVHKRGNGILLTGGTGFVGPFLLKSLLEQTNEPIYVLVRAANESEGKERLRVATTSIGLSQRELLLFQKRVIPVCGDLGQLNLGLTQSHWESLAETVHTVFHNGATVNYLFAYDKMRNANVVGTNEILRLAFEGRPKVFNYISTTFIFGWAVKEVLYETDTNADMDLLDFGYSQSKWVAERLVMDAARKGLPTRVFRPALVTPSVSGAGNNYDIAIRLLSFMVNHGVGVDALNQVSFVPADIAANNIVAISNSPETINDTYHVTRDDYANMVDVTNIITKLTGRNFELYKLPDFVPEVIKRCSKDDLLFPLLDFLISSVDSISSMEFKRYDSRRYQKGRNASKCGKPDPSLENTVRGIICFMEKKGIISTKLKGYAVEMCL
jgi:thioester reductase-like protein